MVTIAAPEIEPEARAVADALVDQRFGSSVVRAADFDIRPDHDGDPAVYFEVRLARPTLGLDTWPVEDLRALRARYRRELSTRAIPMITYLRVVSDEPDAVVDDGEMEPGEG